MAYSNACPRTISPELWDGMSADARYQAQKEVAAKRSRLSATQWALLAPPVLFMALPPVQSLVHKYLPPEQYVKLNGTADPRSFLDKSTLKKGDSVSKYVVTSAYGPRNPLDLPAGASTDHKGVDVGTPIGTPLYAPAVGSDRVTVKCWWDDNGGGTVANVTSESIKEYRFKLLHLSECNEGVFTAGEAIAKTGDSGIGEAHLHLSQMPADADTYVSPMAGYVSWFLDGAAGPNLVDVPALKAAIIGQESNGDHTAVNQHSMAMGLGQIMPENIEGIGQGWDYDALGRDVTAEEFLASPEIQNEIIDHQLSAIALSQSVDVNGQKREPLEIAKRSAAVWYSGQANFCSSTGGEVYGAGSYPSGAEYCASVGEKYQSLQEKRLEQLDK